jgi:hypothetical protein
MIDGDTTGEKMKAIFPHENGRTKLLAKKKECFQCPTVD